MHVDHKWQQSQLSGRVIDSGLKQWKGSGSSPGRRIFFSRRQGQLSVLTLFQNRAPETPIIAMHVTYACFEIKLIYYLLY